MRGGNTTLISGGRLLDGTRRDPINGAHMLVEHGRVSRISTKPIRPPAGARTIDAGGATVMPGLIDTHVHATYRSRDLTDHLRNPPTYNVLRSLEILRETLACGVTTARDLGGADAGFRQAVEEGLVEGPRLLVSIAMISQSGGHGDAWVPAGFRLPKRAWLPSGVADGPDAMRRITRELLMAGADVIKVCTTGGITSLTDSYDEPQLSVEEVRVAVAEAAKRGRTVAAHAEGLAGIRTALEGGVHSLEHGWFIDEECVERMLAQGTWWIPTLALVPRGLQRRDADGSWADAELADERSKEAEIARLMEEQVPLWRHAVERGVNVAMGTDQSHRLLVGENACELAFMADHLGMSPLDVIVASTSRAGECIGRPDLGVLAEDAVADLLVVDGDPLEDLTVLERRERLRIVMKEGVMYRDREGEGR